MVPDRVCLERCSRVRLGLSILRTALEVWSTIPDGFGGTPSRMIPGSICIDGAIVSAAARITSVRTTGAAVRSEIVEEGHLVITTWGICFDFFFCLCFGFVLCCFVFGFVRRRRDRLGFGFFPPRFGKHF